MQTLVIGEPLSTELLYDRAVDAANAAPLFDGFTYGIPRRQKSFEVLAERGEGRRIVERAELPLVEGLISLLDEEDHRKHFLNVLVDGKLRRRAVSAGEEPLVIVVRRLFGEHQRRRQLLQRPLPRRHGLLTVADSDLHAGTGSFRAGCASR